MDGDVQGTVLVVDDEPDALSSIAEVVEAGLPGVRVLTAANGHEALKMLRRHAVDVILTDYRMPGMDGMELLVAAQRLYPGLACILFTAYPDVRLAQRAVNEAHVMKFYVKPVLPEPLTQALHDALPQR